MCYGREGAQIRGSAVLMRNNTPKVEITCSLAGSAGSNEVVQHDAEYKPLIPPEELLQTLLFFKTRTARKVALMRDAQCTHAEANKPTGE